jgi:signal peptidase I
MDSPPANPYAPMAEAAADRDRRPPRWLALLLSVIALPLAGSGLFLLRRARGNWLWLGASILVLAAYGLAAAAAPALVVPAVAAIILLWIAGIVVTAVARPGEFRGWSSALLVAVVLLIGAQGVGRAVRLVAVEAFKIPNQAMMPTLMPGDHIAVSKLRRTPARGDVIVFRYPLDPETDYVKRVIGLPGDTVAITGNQVLINGVPLPRRRLDAPCPTPERPCHLWEEKAGAHTYRVAHDDARPPSDFGPRVIGAGEYFVVGDNRDGSNDSRVWGNVGAALVKGRVMNIIMSAKGNRWARAGHTVD